MLAIGLPILKTPGNLWLQPHELIYLYFNILHAAGALPFIGKPVYIIEILLICNKQAAYLKIYYLLFILHILIPSTVMLML